MPDRGAAQDQLFAKFAAGLLLVLALYGVGMIVVVLWSGDSSASSRMISGFGAMFTGVLGLGSGYLLGRSVQAPETPSE